MDHGREFLLEVCGKFGQPPLARILSVEDGKAENMHSVLRSVQEKFKDSAFIKIHCPSLKEMSFDPGRTTANTSFKAFQGFQDGDFLAELKEEKTQHERIKTFQQSGQVKGTITEEEFYQKYYTSGVKFKYVESFENPMRVLTNNTEFNWIENLEHNTGIPGNYSGISTPWLYVGEAGSLFPFHVEDGNLLSLNFHISGAPKLWYGVLPEDIPKVEEILKEHPAASKCGSYFRHKLHFIDPGYLQSKGIPMFSVTQTPGDIIIPLSFHQGINLGTNVTVAVNKWSGSSDLLKHRVASHCEPKPFCSYEGKSNYMQSVFLPFYENGVIKCQSCPKSFTTKKGLKGHMENQHNISLQDNTKVSKCPICNKMFSQLEIHLKNEHEDSMPKIFCVLCRVPFDKMKLVQRHWKIDHKIEKKCLSCRYVAKSLDNILEDHDCRSNV